MHRISLTYCSVVRKPRITVREDPSIEWKGCNYIPRHNFLLSGYLSGDSKFSILPATWISPDTSLGITQFKVELIAESNCTPVSEIFVRVISTRLQTRWRCAHVRGSRRNARRELRPCSHLSIDLAIIGVPISYWIRGWENGHDDCSASMSVVSLDWPAEFLLLA